MRALSRLGDGIWYLILAGIVIGFGYTGWHEVAAVLPAIPARITLTDIAPIAGIVGLLALMVLTEVLYPRGSHWQSLPCVSSWDGTRLRWLRYSALDAHAWSAVLA